MNTNTFFAKSNDYDVTFKKYKYLVVKLKLCEVLKPVLHQNN